MSSVADHQVSIMHTVLRGHSGSRCVGFRRSRRRAVLRCGLCDINRQRRGHGGPQLHPQLPPATNRQAAAREAVARIQTELARLSAQHELTAECLLEIAGIIHHCFQEAQYL